MRSSELSRHRALQWLALYTASVHGSRSALSCADQAYQWNRGIDGYYHPITFHECRYLYAISGFFRPSTGWSIPPRTSASRCAWLRRGRIDMAGDDRKHAFTGRRCW